MGAQCIDLARVLSVAGDDRSFVEGLLRTFLASTARLERELLLAADVADCARVRDLAHIFKGTLGTVGAARAADLASRIECEPWGDDRSTLEKALLEFRGALREVRDAVFVQLSARPL